jgi:hypothetical protein
MKKIFLFDRHPAGPPISRHAFSGRGFLPDGLLADTSGITHSAAATTLEDGYVPGKFGMMPIPGSSLNQTQRGQKPDTGSGGAGSFAARNAFGAKG